MEQLWEASHKLSIEPYKKACTKLSLSMLKFLSMIK